MYSTPGFLMYEFEGVNYIDYYTGTKLPYLTALFTILIHGSISGDMTRILQQVRPSGGECRIMTCYRHSDNPGDLGRRYILNRAIKA